MRSRLLKPLLFGLMLGPAFVPTTGLAAGRTEAPAASATSAQKESDALKARRPEGGEYFGLYLLQKKVGHIFTDLARVPGHPDQVAARTEFVFKAQVGQMTSERTLKERRVYEARPGGRLLSFHIEQAGDGGDQTLEGTATANGMRVLRKRPGQPNQVLNQPPSKETVEDADQVRVALLRQNVVNGIITDGQDLGHYKVTTTPGAKEQRSLGGVKTHLQWFRTVSEKEKVPVETLMAPDSGAVVEIKFGSNMAARAEAEAVAKRLDKVEVFGLTRVVLPTPLPESARMIPGSVTLTLQGLPESFHTRSTDRQTYVQKPNGSVEVNIKAAKPRNTSAKIGRKSEVRFADYLKGDIIVESDDAQIRALAKQIVGGETNAYAAALKVNAWVTQNLQKQYGASADRATDVLRQKKGDCTEHSLLTVSLLRSLGIPARRVDGVVYLQNEDKVPALYWHEWVEAWVGEWTQMDPTFGQQVADATHLALGEEAQAEITPLIGQLRVTAVK